MDTEDINAPAEANTHHHESDLIDKVETSTNGDLLEPESTYQESDLPEAEEANEIIEADTETETKNSEDLHNPTEYNGIQSHSEANEHQLDSHENEETVETEMTSEAPASDLTKQVVDSSLADDAAHEAKSFEKSSIETPSADLHSTEMASEEPVTVETAAGVSDDIANPEEPVAEESHTQHDVSHESNVLDDHHSGDQKFSSESTETIIDEGLREELEISSPAKETEELPLELSEPEASHEEVSAVHEKIEEFQGDPTATSSNIHHLDESQEISEGSPEVHNENSVTDLEINHTLPESPKKFAESTIAEPLENVEEHEDLNKDSDEATVANEITQQNTDDNIQSKEALEEVPTLAQSEESPAFAENPSEDHNDSIYPNDKEDMKDQSFELEEVHTSPIKEKEESSVEVHAEAKEEIELPEEINDKHQTDSVSDEMNHEELFGKSDDNEKMPWDDASNNTVDNSTRQDVDDLFAASNLEEKLPWEEETQGSSFLIPEEIDESIEYEQLEGGEAMPWEDHEEQFSQPIESNENSEVQWNKGEEDDNSTSVFHPTPRQNRNSTIISLMDNEEDEEEELISEEHEDRQDEIQMDDSVIVSPANQEINENTTGDNFGFLDEDSELLLDDIMDDDFLDDDEVETAPGPEIVPSAVAAPLENRYQPNNRYQPASSLVAENIPSALYSPSTNVNIPVPVPGANLFSPAPAVVAAPGVISVPSPTNKKLAERKKKTDAYDFPVAMLAKTQPSKIAPPPQENIYTRIESRNLHGIPNPQPTIVNQEVNAMPPPASVAPRTLKPKASFFNELPVPVKQQVSSLHLKNPYEVIERSPASTHAVMADTVSNNAVASPRNPYRPISPIAMPKNPYAPAAQPPRGNASPNPDTYAPSVQPVQQQFLHAPPPPSQQQPGTKMYRPLGTGISDGISQPPSLYAPPQQPLQHHQPQQPSFQPKIPLQQNNPYVPANNGHVRAVSNVSTGSIASPLGQGNAMLHNPINNSVFQPASAASQGANRFNPNRLGMNNEQPHMQRPMQQMAPGMPAGKYAPYNPTQQMQQPLQGQQPLHHQQLQPQLHQQLPMQSQPLHSVYGQNHPSDSVTSPKVHNRKNSLLPPTRGGNRNVPPNMSKSMQPAPAVINPENLVLKQWPTFSWSGLTSVAKSIPTNDAYGNHKSVLYVVESNTVLNDEKKLISGFPGPLSKVKTKRKDLDKWVTEKLSLVGVNSPNDPVTSSQQLIWSILKIMINEINTSSDFKKTSYTRQIVELFQPGIKLSENFMESNKFSSVSTYTLSQLQNNNKQFNTHKLDQSGFMRIYSNLQEGNKQAALELAISENDWAMAFLVANLIGKSCFVEVIELYAQYNLDETNAIQKNLAFFLRTFDSDFSSNKFVGQERLFIENFNAFIPFTLLNNPHPENLLIYLSKLFSDAGYHDYSLIVKLLSGFPVYDQNSNSSSSASVDSMIVEEIYEFILQSSATPNGSVPSLTSGFPHTLPIKINHAGTLADYGYLAEAKKYLEFIDSVMKGKPFYITRECFISHQRLSDRLSVSGSNSSGWFTSKKLWGQLDKSFNKFVSGEDVSAVPSPAKTEGVFSNFSPSLNESRSNVDLSRFNPSQSMVSIPQTGIPPQLRSSMSHNALSYAAPSATTFTPGYQSQEQQPVISNPYGMGEDRNNSSSNLNGLMPPLHSTPANPPVLSRRSTAQSGTAISRYAPYAAASAHQPQPVVSQPLDNTTVSPKRPYVATANSSAMSSPLQMSVGLSQQDLHHQTAASPTIPTLKKMPSKYAPLGTTFDTPTPAAKIAEQIASKKSFHDLTAALTQQLEPDVDGVDISEDAYTPPEKLDEVTDDATAANSETASVRTEILPEIHSPRLAKPIVDISSNTTTTTTTAARANSPPVTLSDFAPPNMNAYAPSLSRRPSPGPPTSRNPYAPTSRNASVTRANPYAPKSSVSGLHHATNHYAPVGQNASENKEEESLEEKYNSADANNYSNVVGDVGNNVSSFDYYSYGGYHAPSSDVQNSVDESAVEQDIKSEQAGEDEYKVDDFENRIPDEEPINDDDLPPPSGHMFVPAGKLAATNAFSQPDYRSTHDNDDTEDFANDTVIRKTINNEENLYDDDYDDDVVDDEDDDDDEEDSYAIAQRKKKEEREREEQRKKQEKENKERMERQKKEEEAKKKHQGEAGEHGENGWFGWLGSGKKKDDGKPKPIKAKLGEQSSFYFDEKLGKWINKNAPVDEQMNSNSAPPPPSLKPKKSMANIPEGGTSTAPPSRLPSISGPPSAVSSRSPSVSGGPLASTPPPSGSSAPPAPGARRKPKIDNSIDDLLNISATPGGSGKKKRGPRRGYVDVMSQNN